MANKVVVKGGTIELKAGDGWSITAPNGIVAAISTPTGPIFATSVPVALESDLTDGLAGTLPPIPYKTDTFTVPGVLKVNSISIDDDPGRGIVTVGGTNLVLDGATGKFQATFGEAGPAKDSNGVTDTLVPKSGTWAIKDAGPSAVEIE